MSSFDQHVVPKISATGYICLDFGFFPKYPQGVEIAKYNNIERDFLRVVQETAKIFVPHDGRGKPGCLRSPGELQGVKSSRGEILLFVDDDDLPIGKNWIAQHQDRNQNKSLSSCL